MIVGRILCITQREDEVFITGIRNNTRIGIRYFDGDEIELQVSIRGEGSGKLLVYCGEEEQIPEAQIQIQPSDSWHEESVSIRPKAGRKTLLFVYQGKRHMEFRDVVFS